MVVALLWILVGFLCAAFGQDGGQPSENSRVVPLSANTGTLTLSKVLILTENGLLPLSTTAAAAFFSPKVTCPIAHTNGCIIKVETSSQLWNIPSGAVAQELITVTGGLSVHPASLVNVDSTTTGGLASVHTFQWMINAFPAGSTVTIGVSFDVNSGTADAGYRTETIELYLK
jgi:hypothetical protein